METGAVSEKIKRGKHTTRHSELIHIGEDTYLMDTPGFSSLFLENIEKEDLKYYFPEFEPYENTCRFNGCCHIHEPGCEVKKALEEGKISKLRYDDYCMFYEELAQQKEMVMTDETCFFFMVEKSFEKVSYLSSYSKKTPTSKVGDELPGY